MDKLTRIAFGLCFLLAVYAAAHTQTIGPAPGGSTGCTSVALAFQYNNAGTISCANSYQESANVTSQRNSTNGQTHYIYNTFTDASNYERGGIRFNSNQFEVFTDAGGTGSGRTIRFGFADLSFDVFEIDRNGQVLADISNSDIVGFRSWSAGGSAPSASGTCAATSQVGGNTAGTWTASGACVAGTYILTFGYTAPNGWACDAADRTTPTDTVRQTASSTTTVTFTATTANNDVISYKCVAY